MINISLPVKEISTDITLLDAPEHWRVSNHHPEQTRELISHNHEHIWIDPSSRRVRMHVPHHYISNDPWLKFHDNQTMNKYSSSTKHIQLKNLIVRTDLH